MGNYDQNEYPPPRRGGMGGRWIIAVIIALVGWFMYMSQIQENPMTGERQHVAYSPDQEIRLGLESAPQMSHEMGGEVSATDPHAIEVKKMGNYLVANTDAKKSPWKFQFHLLADDKTVNAFALPGGQIFITMGLLKQLQTEAQLAGVLGHEMGHVIERHTAQQMSKGELGKWLIMAVGAAATDPNNPSSAQHPVMIASLVNQMLQLRYSRHDESQADTWGLKIMEQVGFDPRAMIEVMKILKASSGKDGSGRSLEIFQTHPNPDLRIEQIETYLKENPPPSNLGEGKKLSSIYKNEY